MANIQAAISLQFNNENNPFAKYIAGMLTNAMDNISYLNPIIQKLVDYAAHYKLLNNSLLNELQNNTEQFLRDYLNSRLPKLSTEIMSLNQVQSISVAQTLAWLLSESKEENIPDSSFGDFIIGDFRIEDFGTAFLKAIVYTYLQEQLNTISGEYKVFQFINNNFPAEIDNITAEIFTALIGTFIVTKPELVNQLVASKQYSNPFIKTITRLYANEIDNLKASFVQVMKKLEEMSVEAFATLNGFTSQMYNLSIQFEKNLKGQAFKAQEAEKASYLGTYDNHYSIDEIAIEGHTHNEYLRKDEPAEEAKYLVDENGNIYEKKHFAKKGHMHSEYINKNEIVSADFLIAQNDDGSKTLLTSSDLAPVNHSHNYVSATGQVIYAFAYTVELMQDVLLVPKGHKHNGDYLNRLLKKSEIAYNAFHLNNKPADDFALSQHTHGNKYVTSDEALELGVSIGSIPWFDSTSKGIVIYDEKYGYTRLKGSIAHILSGTITLYGGAQVVNVPNPIHVLYNVISGDNLASMPTYEFVTSVDSEGNVKYTGVRFVPSTSGRTTIQYTIFYTPEMPVDNKHLHKISR